MYDDAEDDNDVDSAKDEKRNNQITETTDEEDDRKLHQCVIRWLSRLNLAKLIRFNLSRWKRAAQPRCSKRSAATPGCIGSVAWCGRTFGKRGAGATRSMTWTEGRCEFISHLVTLQCFNMIFF